MEQTEVGRMRIRGNVAIDLGTVNTLVWVEGRGLVLEEPSAIAVDTRNGRVAAIGSAADVLADKEPQGISVIHPLRDGVIADMDATAEMLFAFLRKALSRGAGGMLRPHALVCVPAGATWVERRSVAAVLGARRPRYDVTLIDEPVAAAAGAGFDLSAGAGGFIVDIGGGTSEVAAVAGWRVVRAKSLRMAGNAMDDAIVTEARAELGMILSPRAARQLKVTFGLTGGAETAEAVGIDAAKRTPRVEQVQADLVANALNPVATAIARSVQEILSDVPSGLAEDVVRGKIRLSGGGALLPGLASHIEAMAEIGAVVAEDPLRCVVRGTAMLLGHEDEDGFPGLRLRLCSSPYHCPHVRCRPLCPARSPGPAPAAGEHDAVARARLGGDDVAAVRGAQRGRVGIGHRPADGGRDDRPGPVDDRGDRDEAGGPRPATPDP
jgi:rod shape-determining protein MreB and related proteins